MATEPAMKEIKMHKVTTKQKTERDISFSEKGERVWCDCTVKSGLLKVAGQGFQKFRVQKNFYAPLQVESVCYAPLVTNQKLIW
jgi:hypothetical protein